MAFTINKGTTVRIWLSENESEAVKIAADNLERDLQKIIKDIADRKTKEAAQNFSHIHIRTITAPNTAGQNAVSDINTDGTLDIDGIPKLDIGCLKDEQGGLRKEAYQISVQNGELIIIGTDRRGTVYGIYSFCEWMGISPWYFWADVPIHEKDALTLPEGYFVSDYPSVEYRGIFINDEEELEVWVQNYMKEPTIGTKTYEKIFELLLRLKANYIWPAMHVNSFNMDSENGALAERMGIVVGTSHCDMLMRSNNREWLPWITKKGYTDAVYDYSIEGRNREILQEYWRESVEQNKDFEVCYTLGMRGIHDSGFETSNLKGVLEASSVEKKRQAKAALLERIIYDQRRILEETLHDQPMMTFIPYKEVLELYDNGLKVPEDMTLVWANDNYGYIRRFPSEREKKRSGGNGIYYHNSYWASPGMSYVFLCSIPLAHTRNELQKAWNEGIRKLWVLNCGAMKPLEQEISFFLRLAWEIGKEGALTENVEAFTADWIDRTFSGGIGEAVSGLLHNFAQISNVRKPENMDYNIFSQTAYGDEAALRIHQYEELFTKGNEIYTALPEEEKAAFYQMVLMRIHAGYFTNLAYYYGDRSTLMYERGNMQAAALYTEKCRAFEDARRTMVRYYNTVMADGKWNGILNPEGYPPPRAAMMPVCTPPLAIVGSPHMRVDIWNGEEELEFVSFYENKDFCKSENSYKKKGNFCQNEKWFEIGNTGTGAISVEALFPEWLTITAADAGSSRDSVEIKENMLFAKIETELRICFCLADTPEPKQGRIVVRSLSEGFEKHIPVRIKQRNIVSIDGMIDCAADCTINCTINHTINCAIEEDGIIILEGDSASDLEENTDFHTIARLGRCQGNLVEVRKREDAKPLTYSFFADSEGAFLLEIHRFPSLNATGRIRIGVSLDDGEIEMVESFSNDEWKADWKKNVLNNVERLYVTLAPVKAGLHQIKLYAVDKYFAFSRLVLYTKPRKENNLAGMRGCQHLPKQWDVGSFCDAFYKKAANAADRKQIVEYTPKQSGKDTLVCISIKKETEPFAGKITPDWYFSCGSRIFEEENGAVRIDAAAALAESRFAWKTGSLWRHCAGESFGRTSLCLYVRNIVSMYENEISADGNLMPMGNVESTWENTAEAPALHYRFRCMGGLYTIWMYIRFQDERESHYCLGIDGKELTQSALYQQGVPFRYEAEQIYHWLPAGKVALEAGEHILDVYSMASGTRFDRFYLTKGEELPPIDAAWHPEAAAPETYKTSKTAVP